MNSLSRRPLRRVLLSTVATAGGVVLLLSLKPHTTAEAAGATTRSAAPAPAPSASATSPAAGSGGSSGASGGTAGTRTVQGDTVQTRYGPVQLKVTLKAGRITAVSALQVPEDSPRDQEITTFAVPQLTQEAIAAQSAKIDTVSGATYTSEGYIQSLQSALDKAGG
ncbi:FMN-binding domain-containing protein [Actinacidiphila yanglinensis]|uniref:FMN-binding domain-containing protein n=1 Tax=Actinacidiphila yanglinensis TaxID=310779 RepID=A0A1H6DFB5_9ACTN|nr:FMN-binding protein [Actinacidiphila yanglinensis]SEG83395.1 FMN-binding domain-containing protein [Actinacidiphila yanglinensis]